MPDRLAAVLGDFARTLTTDFSIQEILDELVVRVVEVLPITAAGVTLISPGKAPHYVAASDDLALRFERLQTEVGQGPCLLAYESGTAVVVPDLHDERRFPTFTARAIDSGLRAVFTFPLRHGDGRLGALDLYRTTAGTLDLEELAAAQTLADVTAAYLLNAQARESAREASDRYRHSSQHDSLTGLPNRSLLQQRLEHAAERARGSHSYTGVLFVDLDHFKAVNDTHGHEVGDALLREVARRLETLIQPGDTLARVYGDEFVFVCEDLPTSGATEAIAARVQAAFDAPFLIEAHGRIELTVSASIGLAYAGLGEEVSAELLVNADIAMYQAKRRGAAGHRIVDLREAPRISDRSSLRGHLADAFALDKLDLAYQPIVRVVDGGLVGVEVLLRWAEPGRGPIPSHIMVEVAEQNGLNTRIGAWVLARACADRSRWLRDHPGLSLDLWVNISNRQLLSPGFCGDVAAILTSTATPPAALVMELTNSIGADDVDRAVTVLDDLRGIGLRLVLDNFGVGYSSFSQLGQFPIDGVKVDRSLITGLGRAPIAEAVLTAITGLAHTLGRQVTAVGIETPEQQAAIATVGCDQAQGFLYSRPLPSVGLTALLASSAGSTPMLAGRTDRPRPPVLDTVREGHGQSG